VSQHNREALLALAARVEAASGPDRQLDFAIFRALRPEYAGPEWQPFAGGLRHVNDSSDMRCMPDVDKTPPHYTAILDAALTLVPDGYKWALHSADDHSSPVAYCVPNMGRLPWPDWVNDVEASTPALALTAASLRALAEVDKGEKR
jgi:hypothetical protein